MGATTISISGGALLSKSALQSYSIIIDRPENPIANNLGLPRFGGKTNDLLVRSSLKLLICRQPVSLCYLKFLV